MGGLVLRGCCCDVGGAGIRREVVGRFGEGKSGGVGGLGEVGVGEGGGKAVVKGTCFDHFKELDDVL